MLTVYSDQHRLHAPAFEILDGELTPVFEKPERADLVLARVRERQLGPVALPSSYGLAAARRVHRDDYLDYLAGAHAEWLAAGHKGDVLPYVYPVRSLRQLAPRHIDGKAGYYAMDASAPICAGTWQAAQASLDCALTGLDALLAGARGAFALCRPPGHHAGTDFAGGYCYLNNAAIAAQAWRDAGAAKVALLDVDYHHGNGSQAIFYRRADVVFASIHGHPADEYPFFLGYADERGEGDGLGSNFNYPLPLGSGFALWRAALDDACAQIARSGATALVVSLGVDTFKDDPISQFKLDSDDYLRIGERIAALGVPTLFVLEGGYAVADIGVNAVNVLEGFESAQR
ncbi:histone deacetylase family protein [Chitinimonas koreensis]|uniref:histone deacetylase family protein n=1 Tax=Chitinimonas koreensis TaxID=356302 RepID=UPI00040024CD|nr:histone deacetylase family protein [Chitinimonas koreensis]QNM95718.1 histone deacetylase family protein [Chitinimonas koreensis]